MRIRTGFTTYRPLVSPKKQKPKMTAGQVQVRAPRPGSTNFVGGAPSPAAPKPPAPPAQPAAPPDARDATYFTDTAGIDALYAGRSADLQADISNYGTRGLYTQRALARLLERKPEDVSDARNAYNTRGLFYSGAMSKKLGDIEIDYARRQQDINSAAETREKSVRRAMAELDTFYGPNGIKRSEALNNATGRQIEMDQSIGVPDQSALDALIAALTPKPAPKPPRVTSSHRQPSSKPKPKPKRKHK